MKNSTGQEQEGVKTQEAEQKGIIKNDLPFEEMYSVYLESYKKQTADNPFFNIAIPEEVEKRVLDAEYRFGKPDNNNCIVVNGFLVRYVLCQESVARISDGVIVLNKNSLSSIMDRWRPSRVSQIILPDSVREIRQGDDEFYAKGYSMNIPCGYLLQKRKLPIESLMALLRTVWRDEASMMDWVSVYLYQNSKKLIEDCTTAFKKSPSAFVAAALVILDDQCGPSEIDRIGEMVFELRKDIRQEYIDKFYVFARKHKGKKAVSALTPYASSSVGGKLIVKTEYKNDLEEFCEKNFEKHELERIMRKNTALIARDFEKSGVKYCDRDEEVSAFVLECAILPYVGQLTEKPRNIRSYKTDYSKFAIIEKSDQIASRFEKASFARFIERITEYAGGYKQPHVWIPVCRFGSGEQIKTLISEMKEWSEWYICGSSGRMGIMACRGAIMLSDTREAMMYAEKCKCLNYYARIRGTTADVIRDTKLADFGFNGDGKKVYDLGNTIIEASIGDDLSILLTDTKASKTVKSLPKKGSDTEKYDACAADYSDLKKNVKKVVKARNDLLFERFLSGEKIDCASWTAAYTGNPVLNKVARLLVWTQGKQTFTLDGAKTVDSLGNDIVLDPSCKIAVAHPLEMEDADIVRWQKYFSERKLKQPFEQIWEPKVRGKVEKDRYAGCLIPFYRFSRQEKHGITVEDYDFHDKINIYFQDCSATVKRIDWVAHFISATDRFEIKSFDIIKLNRRTNHIIYYLDKCTIFGRIEQDDTSALQYLDGYTVAQIESFLKYAMEKGSVNCTAMFLDYKNEHFADFAAMDEFTLDL